MAETSDAPTTSAQHELVITRVFDAPAEAVFDAWLNPISVGRWLFATPDGEMIRVEIDARAGGAFTVVEKRGDTLAEHFGEYLEIDRPRRLVFTFATDREEKPSLVTVEIKTVVRGCELTLTHRIGEEWAAYLERTREGWTNILEGLAVALADRELVITRVFDAPRELVWKAWTDPEMFTKWWGPKGFTTPVCKIDLRVGGVWLNCMRSPEGQDFWSTGVYREIVEPERIVTTDSFADADGNPVPASYYGMTGDWSAEALITVTFEEHEGKTKLTLGHVGIPAGENRDGAQQGWSESFDKLAESLAEA